MTDLPTLTTQAIVAQTERGQAVAANPDISIWASANAGAGKTKVLIDRIARLLLKGSEPAKILAVTYTKAAASEMQTRLYELLGSWTIAPNAKLKEALIRLDPDFSALDDTFLAHARALFAKALETPGGLKIQTIHAFCQTILQRFPLEAGIPPGFKVLDDAETQQLQAKAFDEAATKEPEAFKTLARLTSQSDHHALVLNSLKMDPGLALRSEDTAGKLAKTLQIEPSTPAATYFNDAVTQLDKAALNTAAAALEAGGTIDKASAEKLRIMANSPDRDTILKAWRELVWTQKNEPKVKTYAIGFSDNLSVTSLLAGTKDAPSYLCNAFSQVQDKVRAISTYDRSMALTRATFVFHDCWTQTKHAIGALDFDDLLTKTAALLQAGEGAAAWVLYKLDAGIDHILIDEAQDTNPAQWDLLAPLFATLEQDKRAYPRTRFIVGDEKQSIYSFQGAKPERFLQEKLRFEESAIAFEDGRASLEFDLSFRSGQAILNAVDAVWARTRLQLAKTEEFSGAPDAGLEAKYAFPTKHIAFRDHYSGVVELWPLTEPGEKAPTKEAWDHPLDIEREDSSRNRLAERIALEIKARLDRGFTIPSKKGPDRLLTPGDIMILVKGRGPFFHQLIKRLKFHKVPVAGADRIRLNEDPAIQDLMALARFALLPQDDFNLACVLKGAFCGLVDDNAHLFPLAYDRKGASLWDRLLGSKLPQHREAAKFLTAVLSRAAIMAPFEFFASILEREIKPNKTGWTTLIERLGPEAREPVEAFLAKAIDHSRKPLPNLTGFLFALENDASEIKREAEQGANGVRVMTIHGAKGLEAPVVILPDTTSPRSKKRTHVYRDETSGAWIWSPFPAEDTQYFSKRREETTEAERREDARLLYVAMTRARDVLILCGFHFGAKAKDQDKEEKPKDMWFDLFKTALPLLGEGQEVAGASFNYRMWGTYLDTVASSAATPPDLAPIPDWVNQPPPMEAKPLRRVAPSILTPDGAAPAALSPLTANRDHRFKRGRLIHELLQHLPDAEPQNWSDLAKSRLAREGELSEIERDAICIETLAIMHDPQFAALFGPTSRAEAAIVGRGPGLPEDMVVNGSVDRLVVTEHEVLVLDFKTNRPPPSRVEDVAQVYLNQMAAYRALLQAHWPDKVIRCALLWTDGPRLMALPDQVLDQALRVIAALPRL